MHIRKIIKDFLTENPNSTEAAIVADCAAKNSSGHASERASKALAQMTSRGKIVKTGNSYTLA